MCDCGAGKTVDRRWVRERETATCIDLDRHLLNVALSQPSFLPHTRVGTCLNRRGHVRPSSRGHPSARAPSSSRAGALSGLLPRLQKLVAGRTWRRWCGWMCMEPEVYLSKSQERPEPTVSSVCALLSFRWPRISSLGHEIDWQHEVWLTVICLDVSARLCHTSIGDVLLVVR